MLRPSAFPNNGRSSDTETASSSRSILRPSSFQLAPSALATANNCNNKTECNNEPSTTSPSDSPFEVKEAKPSTSVDSGSVGGGCSSSSSSGVSGSVSGSGNTSGGSSASGSTSNETAKEDDSKISSTTNNDGENNGEHNSDEAKVITNPFNNSKIKSADLDEENETEAKPKSKPDTSDDDDNKSEASKSADLPGKGLFTSSTKNLFAAAASKAPTMNNGSESNFVFGQNIHERIVGVPDTSAASADAESQSGSKLFAMSGPSTGEPSSAGSSTNGAEAKESSTVENLTKVAREYEESRVQKRKLDAVETFTGEENESNILDVSCKLFAFVASNWEQRGPGSLRLNDVTAATNEDARSRLVFRTLGNFRVLLNTKVWGGMVVEKPSQKSLRLTAIDANDGAVKIYLVMARPDDISILYSALKKRIDAERKREKTVESTTSSDSIAEANTSKRSHHDDDDDDDNGDEQPDTKKDRTN